jgi:EmrB/QacA subfamily drug resistance transporter
MRFDFSRFSTEKNRWYALIVITLALAIVVIDNTVLNVSIPYMLRDLNTNLSSIEWVISGYALTIATILITVGRLGDMIGRKRVFIIGILIFAAGSFIGSTATEVTTLIIGRAIIQAVGAAMALTSALSLIASNFQGKERALAFGLWGAVAGVSVSIGPLLGGYLTTYYSWQWSLRINVIIAIIAIIGSVFIKESKGEQGKRFDWVGTVLSGMGFFSLVFGFIEGQKYGWFVPNETFSLFGYAWPLQTISVIPFIFASSFVFLALFVIAERHLEKRNRSPVLRMSLFRNRGFSMGLATLGILAFGQFGLFFMMPIYLENVLALNAFQTGIFFLPASVSIFIFGTLSGITATRINPKWLVMIGMLAMSAGSYLIIPQITATATLFTMAPALIIYGIGIGLGSAQLTNVILSSTPVIVAGEASATATTFRQVGSSIGIAIIGALLATSLIANMTANIQADNAIPANAKSGILSELGKIDVESGQINVGSGVSPAIEDAVKKDVENALVESTQSTLFLASVFIVIGTVLSFFIPPVKIDGEQDREKYKNKPSTTKIYNRAAN